MYQWDKAGGINVTSTSLPFFTQLVPNTTVGYYLSSSASYSSLVSAVTDYADGFVSLVQTYTLSDGQLSEQYLKSTGVPTSAVKLTWSFAAALTAFDAKSNFVPASWGATGLTTTTCGISVAVTFNEYATTVLGENIYIVGSISRECYILTLRDYEVSLIVPPSQSSPIGIPIMLSSSALQTIQRGLSRLTFLLTRTSNINIFALTVVLVSESPTPSMLTQVFNLFD